jgi:predicted secreted hydrolase
VNPQRRRWLLGLAAGTAALRTRSAAAALPETAPDGAARPLRFPLDHGAHLAAHTEWWYATGWLAEDGADVETASVRPAYGFQLTFFRSRTGLAQSLPGRFAPRQLLFAHAALTVLPLPGGGDAGQHLHDQRIARWSGAPGDALADAATDHGELRLGRWRLRDAGTAWLAVLPAEGFGLDLKLARTQPLLLQGEAGVSRKGPEPQQTSRYVTEPQLAAIGSVVLGDRTQAGLRGRAWLDHEWSDDYLPAQAVGWDWIGINLFDGSALTAFVIRRADGRAVWAGGSFRRAGQAPRNFAPDELQFSPGRRWHSPASGASYPVDWTVATPAGRFSVRALLDDQELDSRGSTGAIYWEGLSELQDAQGRRVGLGYLEMTGYAQALQL